MRDIQKTKSQLLEEIEQLRRENKRLSSESGGFSCVSKRNSGNELVRTALYASPFPVISIDTESKITLWNKAAENLFGWREDEIIGKFIPIVPEEKKQEHEELKERILKENSLSQVELVRKKKDGSYIPVMLSSEPLKNSAGEIVELINTFVDNSLRKLSYLKYHVMFNTMKQGVIYQNADGIIIDTNPAAEKILGIDRNDLIGRSLNEDSWQTIREDGSEYKADEYPALVAFKERREIKNNIMGVYNAKDKAYRWMIIHAVPLFKSGAKTPFQVYATFEDITERKKAEYALRISEQKNRAILSAIPDVIFTFNKTGVCTNYRAENNGNFPMDPSVFLNRKIEEFVPEYINKLFYKNLNAAFITGKMQTYVFDMKVGERLYYIEGRMIRYKDDEVLIVVRNITDRILMERKLEKDRENLEEMVKERTISLIETNKKLALEIKKQKQYDKQIQEALIKEKELGELKSKFISMASHEYKTPLTTIKIFTDLIKIHNKKISEEKFLSYIQKIHDSVDYMTELINNVILVNRGGKGNLKFDPQLVDIRSLCITIVDDFKINDGKYHNLHLSLSDQLNNFPADERMIKQMLINLLSNAVKYSNAGSNIFLKVYAEDSKVVFKLTDEGIGIHEKDKPNLFEAFYRGKNSGTIPGTGLGLTIVKDIVVSHGGTVHVDSEINKGTTFTINFPLKNK